MKVSIRVSTLKAAVCCAAEKDFRTCLNSVHFDFVHGEVPRLRVVSTDGTVLFAASEPLEYLEGAQTADFSLTLPVSAIKTAVKTKSSEITLEALPDGRYLVGDTITSTIDGKFPDYLRVIPKHNAKLSEAPLQFDVDLLACAQNALRHYHDDKKGVYRLSHLENIAVLHSGSSSVVVVIMPLRVESAFSGHNSNTYQGFYLS